MCTGASQAPVSPLPGFVPVATLPVLKESARHHLTLRHRGSGEYHNLLLFTFPPAAGTSSDVPRLYCMEAACPHVGAPLENAHVQPADPDSDVEENELELADMEDMVVVCPWHEYDFNLRTGESSHGLNACVYEVKTHASPDSGETGIWVQAPKPLDGFQIQGDDWELVERRAVSESFSHQYAAVQSHIDPGLPIDKLTVDEQKKDRNAEESDNFAAEVAAVLSPDPPPTTLVEWACLILRTGEPARKVAYTQQAVREFRAGKVRTIGGGLPRSRPSDCEEPAYNASSQVADGQGSMPPLPPRDKEINAAYEKQWEWRRPPSQVPPHTPVRQDTVQIMEASKMGQRSKGSRLKMLHSLANIELWAIDLAWDIIVRGQELAHRHAFAYFHPSDGKSAPKLPAQFYADFAKVAEDEAKHFSLLQERLLALEGIRFGELPIHASLWDSALETCHSLAARLSIIHLVHEARGLDVNPQTIAKFARAKDGPSTDVLNVIHLDEVTHVAAGHRWLTWLCHHASSPQLDPVQVFRQEVKHNFVGRLKGPFNIADRAKAGLVRSVPPYCFLGERPC